MEQPAHAAVSAPELEDTCQIVDPSVRLLLEPRQVIRMMYEILAAGRVQDVRGRASPRRLLNRSTPPLVPIRKVLAVAQFLPYIRCIGHIHRSSNDVPAQKGSGVLVKDQVPKAVRVLA